MAEVTDLQVTPGTDRVRAHTASSVQADLDQKLVNRLAEFAETAGSEAERTISDRLSELDAESDIERILEGNAGVLALTGTLLGAFVDRRWLALPGMVTAFLIQHSVQGWCPPVAVFRRMGVRTRQEIEAERAALKFLRGDCDLADQTPGASARDRAEAALRAALA